jgi:hypothetical protein
MFLLTTKVMDDGVRSAFTDVWGPWRLSNEKGLTVTEIPDAVHVGDIKSILAKPHVRPRWSMPARACCSTILWCRTSS